MLHFMQYRLSLYLYGFNISTCSQVFIMAVCKVYSLHIWDFFCGNKMVIYIKNRMNGGLPMSKQQEMHYKETTPIATVEKLKSILNQLGVEIDEDWQPASSIGTYALRATFKGTNVGTNGKGISKE